MSTYSQNEAAAESATPVRIGEMLAGKYRVERILGIGGMGIVVAATHVQLDQLVAIKFLLPQALANAEVVARFAREARAAAKITSEHVARVIDVGELPTGTPYMVMEYLSGNDLAQLLARRGPLPIEEAVEYVLQASEALAEAHAKGIVHRDLKPANLFLTARADGTSVVKVLDFGISKGGMDKTTPADMSLTKTSTMMGSPMYMSPEQMKSSRDVDWRTDIWSLGVILYELLAGRPPFSGETMPELLARIITEEPAPLRAVRPDVPPALEAVLLRCLAKNLAQRTGNIAELAHALAPFAPKRGRASAERVSRVMEASGIATGLPTPVPPPHAGSPPGSSAGAVTGATAAWSPATDHDEKKRSSWKVAAAAGAAAMLVGGALGVWKFSSSGQAGPNGQTADPSANPGISVQGGALGAASGPAGAPIDVRASAQTRGPAADSPGATLAASAAPAGAGAELAAPPPAASAAEPAASAAPARTGSADSKRSKSGPGAHSTGTPAGAAHPATTQEPAGGKGTQSAPPSVPTPTAPPAAPAPTTRKNPLSIDIK